MSPRGKSILVVDDSRVVLTYTSVLLHRMGYEASVAQNSADAIELAKLRNPNVIFLDVIMPGKNGVETLKELRENDETTHIPVVMFSVSNDAETIEKCKKLGCMAYLSKPLKIREIHNAIESCLALKGGPTRETPRISFEKKIQITRGGENKPYHAVNLSEGGVFVRCMAPLPIGSLVDMLIPIDENQSLSLKGEVIYTKDILYGGTYIMVPGMAIKFKDMNKKDKKTLARTIQGLLASDLLEEQDLPVLEIEQEGN